MTDWIVRRWARYGHERLYAETPGGTALGYLDVKTGLFHSDDVSNLPLLERAIADHLAMKSRPAPVARADAEAASESPVPSTAVPPADVPSATAAAAPVPASAPVAELSADPGPAPRPAQVPDVIAPLAPEQQQAAGWEDISGARPGAAARERAIAERQAAPVRTVLARLLGVKTDERAWRIGADGEEAVAAQLAKLGPTWRLLHAVRVGDRGSDIDHVVIGPGGVFTVNAKHHPKTSVWVGGDTFMVNGQRVPYIRNSRHEARRAARLLTEHTGFPVAVTGIVAVMGAHNGFTIKEQPHDGAVVVVQRKRISQYLLGLGARLSVREVEAIFDVARRSTTWQ